MKNKKVIIIIGVVAAVLIIAGIVTAIILSGRGKGEENVVSLGTEVIKQEEKKEEKKEKREQVSIFKRRR